MRLRFLLTAVCALVLCACVQRVPPPASTQPPTSPRPPAGFSPAPGQAPLSGGTGVWDTPTAQVLPDWTLRPAFGWSAPHRAYGFALGLFDRLEVHGQFTEVTTREGFADEPDYGSFKDRSMGIKAVLLPEDGYRPQLAVGANDLTGTGLFSSRYAVLDKSFDSFLGPARLSLGLGQGVLGGQALFTDPQKDDGQTGNARAFHTSGPFRRTRAFGGLQLRLTDRLLWAAEYSSLPYDALFGYDTPAAWPVNAGLKYHLLDQVWLTGALMRGNTPALGLAADLPLTPQGLFAWRKELDVEPRERLRWQAALATPQELAKILAGELADEGFEDVLVRVAGPAPDAAIWAEAKDGKHLSVLRGLGRMARRLLAALPGGRDRLLYLNLIRQGRIVHSLKARAGLVADYLDGRIDQRAFLEFASLEREGREHLAEFMGLPGVAAQASGPEDRFDWNLEPKIRTFLNNRHGFVRSKSFVRAAASYRPWAGGLMLAETETTLHNGYANVAFQPLEPDSVRTDIVEFERRRGTRVTQLAYDQLFALDYGFWGRIGCGYLESAYAGLGAEVFRLFSNGRLGFGMQSDLVLKRSPDSSFGVDRHSPWFQTLFANVYAQLWPDQGVSLALKGGRFLAGDPGVRLELRRTRGYYTVGAWATFTDTSRFTAPENQGAVDKGVFISVPLSIFFNHEAAGRSTYSLTGFTRDQGQTVRQPRTLFPSHPDDTVARTKRDMEELRR